MPLPLLIKVKYNIYVCLCKYIYLYPKQTVCFLEFGYLEAVVASLQLLLHSHAENCHFHDVLNLISVFLAKLLLFMSQSVHDEYNQA